MAEKFWVRRHSNGWRGIVKQVEDGTYWAAVTKAHPWGGVASQKCISTLEQAMAIADDGVKQKARRNPDAPCHPLHSCEDLQCDLWPEHPSELMD